MLHREFAASLGLLGLLLQSGCYHYKIRAPRPDPATPYQQRTAVSWWWGIKQPDIRTLGCETPNAIDEVKVTKDIRHVLAMMLTLGIAAPLKVEWRCAKQQVPVDTTAASPR